MLASYLSPQGYLKPSGPRAAFSHSASVGKRLLAQLQNALHHSSYPLTGLLGLLRGDHPSMLGKDDLMLLKTPICLFETSY
ncbi:MAG: hypothetical protein CM1200mP16_06080 [Nitrospina sp.]|nr:MAG: hypothetical protein CM1200mP16_06080 [Nitrospina sp.]